MKSCTFATNEDIARGEFLLSEHLKNTPECFKSDTEYMEKYIETIFPPSAFEKIDQRNN